MERDLLTIPLTDLSGGVLVVMLTCLGCGRVTLLNANYLEIERNDV